MIYTVKQTAIFTKWAAKLKNHQARIAVTIRIDRITAGNFGDTKPLGEGVRELRIHTGAGYRVYFCERGEEIIILLCGGDKSSQQKDIKRAQTMVKEV